MQKTIIYVKD